MPPDVHEARLGYETPTTMVERVARLKAGAVETDLPVVAADTSVVLDGKVLGKPGDEDTARSMLAGLAGRSHTVATGIAVRRNDEVRSRVVTAEVTLAPMTHQEITWYVGTGEPLDKAGAYGLGGIGNAFVQRIAGSFSTVIGLPLTETVTLLRWADVTVAGA